MNDNKELFDLLAEEQSKNDAPEPSKKGRENKDVLKFIQKMGLIPGPNRVPTYMIYYQYVQWFYKYWGSPWGKEEFFRTFKMHFEQKRSGNQRFYMINDGLDLTDEMYEKAKKYETKWQKRGKGKTVKKVKDPIPRPE